MNNRIGSIVAALAVLIAAAPATATTYTGVRELSGSLRGALSLTTDGTTGVLTAANILDFSIVLSGLGARAANYGSHVFIGADANHPLILQGSSLTATATRLFFDFDSGNGVFGVESPYYLLTSANCGCFQSSIEFYELDPEFGNRISRSGMATLGAVPEPASWALMVTGFGLTGAMLRRRKGRSLRV